MVQDLWDKFFGSKLPKEKTAVLYSEDLEYCDICNRYIEWDGHTSELHYKALLKEAHDNMDDLNNNTPDGAVCWYCHEAGYDGNGLIHTDDCILVKIRKVL